MYIYDAKINVLNIYGYSPSWFGRAAQAPPPRPRQELLQGTKAQNTYSAKTTSAINRRPIVGKENCNTDRSYFD